MEREPEKHRERRDPGDSGEAANPLAVVREEVRLLGEEVGYHGRIIDGVPREGQEGLRERVARIENALERAEDERGAIRAREEGKAEELERQRKRVALLGKALMWIGPAGLVSVVTAIVYAIQNAGGQ